MPRTARLDAHGIFHHVMIRGIERRNIFRNKKDREYFLDRFTNLIPETVTACYGWAFLSNHVHFLFRTGETPLSTLIRRLLTGYVVGFNRRHKRHGQLFQNRFKSIVCQEAYRQFMEDGLHQGHREELVGGGLVRSVGGWSSVKKGQGHTMCDERILDDNDFVDLILSQAGGTLERHYQLKSLGYNFQRVVERVAEIFKIKVDEIYTHGRQAHKVKAKSFVCYWAVRELGIFLSKLANIFKMSALGIGYAAERGEKMVRSDGFKLVIYERPHLLLTSSFQAICHLLS